VTRCEAQALQEHSENAVGVPITHVGLSMMIAMTARAGYLTIRLGPIRHTFDTVRQALAEGLA
jgi:hypothetical protein